MRAFLAASSSLALTAAFFARGSESRPATPGPLETTVFMRAREVLQEAPRIVAGFAHSGRGPGKGDRNDLLWAIGNTRCFHQTSAPASRPLSVEERKTVNDLLAREELRRVFAKYREINLFPPDAGYQVLAVVPADGKLGIIRAWEHEVSLDGRAANPKSERMGDSGGWDQRAIAAAWNAVMDGARVVFK